MNIFNLYDTHGLPIEITLELMQKNNISPNIYQFYLDSKKANWSFKTFIARLRDPFIDVYGKNDWEDVYKKLLYLESTNSISKQDCNS